MWMGGSEGRSRVGSRSACAVFESCRRGCCWLALLLNVAVRTREINADRDARRDTDRAPFPVECRVRSCWSEIIKYCSQMEGMYYRPPSVSQVARAFSYFKAASRFRIRYQGVEGGR